jgi:hypothetical protein
MKRRCSKCSRYLKDPCDARRLYYLNRPTPCSGSQTKEEEYEAARECSSYTTKRYFTDEGGLADLWERRDDDFIPVYTTKPQEEILNIKYDSFFRQGFFAAVKLLNNNFQKDCKNCSHSNRHIVNRCEKTTLCDHYELDYLRSFDKLLYGHLCDSCNNECKDDTKPITHCHLWSPTQEDWLWRLETGLYRTHHRVRLWL